MSLPFQARLIAQNVKSLFAEFEPSEHIFKNSHGGMLLQPHAGEADTAGPLQTACQLPNLQDEIQPRKRAYLKNTRWIAPQEK